jgi:hypothetical protein
MKEASMRTMVWTTMSDHLFDIVFLLFPFWCFDIKGGEELSISIIVHRFIWIWLVRLLFSMCWPCGHVF